MRAHSPGSKFTAPDRIGYHVSGTIRTRSSLYLLEAVGLQFPLLKPRASGNRFDHLLDIWGIPESVGPGKAPIHSRIPAGPPVLHLVCFENAGLRLDILVGLHRDVCREVLWGAFPGACPRDGPVLLHLQRPFVKAPGWPDEYALQLRHVDRLPVGVHDSEQGEPLIDLREARGAIETAAPEHVAIVVHLHDSYFRTVTPLPRCLGGLSVSGRSKHEQSQDRHEHLHCHLHVVVSSWQHRYAL